MKCPKCGKIMVEENLNVIYCSHPPSILMICKCGYKTSTMSKVIIVKSWEERWDEKNERKD